MAENVTIRRIDAAANIGFDEASPFFFTCIFRNWALLRQLTVREIKGRYESSILGIFWAFFTPLVSLVIYSVVFGYIFNAQWQHNGRVVAGMFPIVVLCGLTFYNFFSESLSASARVVSSHANYVKKVVFPLEILPLAGIFSALFFCAIWLAITLAGAAYVEHRVHATAVCLPLLLLPLILFTMGLCWFTASLGVYVRDVPHAVGIILLVMLYLTGIFYPPDVLPQQVQDILFLNPLAALTEQARRVLLFGEWPEWGRVFILIALSVAIAQAGYLWFVRTKRGFADVL